jgi:hypothetical protein
MGIIKWLQSGLNSNACQASVANPLSPVLPGCSISSHSNNLLYYIVLLPLSIQEIQHLSSDESHEQVRSKGGSCRVGLVTISE